MDKLDSILDQVSDSATMVDLERPADEGDAAVLVEPAAEAEPAEEASESEEAEPEAESGDEAQPADELVEIEWYGKRGKLSKDLEGYMHKQYTEKHQRLSEEHRQRMSEVEAKAAEAERRLREAEEYRDLIEDHLRENPQFHESWKRVEQRNEPVKRELAAMQAKFDSFIQQQQIQQAEAQVRLELGNLSTRFKLENGTGYDKEDIERLALAEVVTSGYAIPLEDAYQRQVARANSRVRGDKLRKLQSAASAQALVPPARPARGGSKPQSRDVKAPKKSLDDLLAYHLSLPNSAFERG